MLINIESKTRETSLPVKNIEVPSKKSLILGFMLLVVAMALRVVPAIRAGNEPPFFEIKNSLIEPEIQRLSDLMTVFNTTVTILLISGIALTAYHLATCVSL